MISETMQVSDSTGILALVTTELLSPLDTEVQIEVQTCSVNFADTLIVKGKYQEKPELPFAPGMEIVGTVKEIGAFLNVDADFCIPLPDDADPITYAALPIAYGTSHLALFHRAKIKPSDTLVVLGASGGVGLTAVELGVLAGAKVIACARGEEKLAVAKSKGAHHLIDTQKSDLRDELKALGGADIVYDPVGGDLFKSALRACNPEARVLPLGFASGEIPQIPANILLVKNIDVLGFYWGGYRKFAPDVMNESLRQIMEWAKDGKIKPHVSNVLPLNQANEALSLLSNRQATGKVVVDMSLG